MFLRSAVTVVDHGGGLGAVAARDRIPAAEGDGIPGDARGGREGLTAEAQRGAGVAGERARAGATAEGQPALVHDDRAGVVEHPAVVQERGGAAVTGLDERAVVVERGPGRQRREKTGVVDGVDLEGPVVVEDRVVVQMPLRRR